MYPRLAPDGPMRAVISATSVEISRWGSSVEVQVSQGDSEGPQHFPKLRGHGLRGCQVQWVPCHDSHRREGR